MQRRNFVKKSIAAAIVAATPLALTGLVKADGGGGTGSTSTDSTDWWDTTGTTNDSTDESSTTESWTTEMETTASGPCTIGSSIKYKYLSGTTWYCFKKYTNAADGRECFWDDHICQALEGCSGVPKGTKPSCS